MAAVSKVEVDGYDVVTTGRPGDLGSKVVCYESLTLAAGTVEVVTSSVYSSGSYHSTAIPG